jgi:hypothetical protein
MAKSDLRKAQEKCDKLLTPIIKKLYPKCEACGHETQVAHHWIEKSRSNYLRYDLRNLVALCHSCHARIHNRFGNNITSSLDIAETIIKKRGKKWREQLDKDAHKLIKVNVDYYKQKLAELNDRTN